MKAFILGLFTLCFAATTLVGAETAKDTSHLTWTADYQEALQKANQTGKPVLLFFTGTDWCPWCRKLDAEVFETPDFNQAAGDRFVFVKVDYLMHSKVDPSQDQQTKKLIGKYGIQAFPTVVIIDGKENVIGQTGYQAGGGKSYATHLDSLTKTRSR